MSILSTIKRINYYRKVYANWISVILNVKRHKELIHVKFRNEKAIKNSGICTLPCSYGLVDLVEHGFLNPKLLYFNSDGKLYYNGHEVIQDSYLSFLISICGFMKNGNIWYHPQLNAKFKEPINYSIYEVFCLEDYGGIDVNGREVVDIGGNVGDSAIYFALKGGKYVYSFEPLPNVYNVAIENIKLNGLENKIKIINAGIASKEGEILVPSNFDVEKSHDFSVNNKGDIKIPIYSIENIRKMIKDPYLLEIGL